MKLRNLGLDRLKNHIETLSNKKTKVQIKIEKQYASLFRHEIEDYKNARTSRYATEFPKTWQMQELYKDAVKGDAHLRGAIANRRLRSTNKKYVIRDNEGVADPDRTKLITKKWFKDSIALAVDSNFYGYSHIWPSKFEGNEIKEVKLIPRGHCVPETGHILFSPYDDTGLAYEEIPEMIWYASLGEDAIGLLETGSPLTIFKRHSWANWDEWEQIFGQPLRIAYTSGDDSHMKRVAGWLLNMGRAAFGVFRKDVDNVEIVETKHQDAYQVFDKKRQAVNEEISKLINGQTMTVDQGSSRSQGEVHLKTQNEITKDDHDNVIMWCNDTLLPALRFYGYDIPEGYSIDIEEVSIPSEKIVVDQVIMEHSGYKFKKEYLESTYGIDLEENEEELEGSSVKKSLRPFERRVFCLLKLATLYKGCCTLEEDAGVTKADETPLVKISIDRIAKNVLSGRLESGMLDRESFAEYYRSLTKGVREGFGKAAVKLGSPNERILQEIRLNVATFGAFKNHSFTEQLIGLLTDEDGKLRGRSDFLSRAIKLDSTYNKRWFQVERDMVIGKSRSGIQWNAMQKRKHLFPNVKRREIIDGRTRPSHVPLNGLIVSMDDQILDTHWAPDAPGCRGSMTQTSAAVDHKGINLDELKKDVTPWNINPGKFGKVVDDTHPYYQVSDLKEATGRARVAVIANQQREIIQLFKGKNLKLKDAEGKEVLVTRTRIEEVLRHYSQEEWYRNELLFNIKEVFKSASYFEKQAVVEGKHPEAIAFHVYKIKLHDRTWFIKVKELKGKGERLLSTIGNKK